MNYKTVLLVALGCALWPHSGAAQPDPFATCHEAFDATPDDPKAAMCFASTARAHALWTEGEAAIDAQLQRHPSNAGLLLARAHLSAYQNAADAPERYAEAAEAFAAIGSHRGVALANINRSRMLTLRGRHDEAGAALEDALAAAERDGGAELLASVRNQRADQIMRSGGDLSRAYLLLREVEESLFPGGSLGNRTLCAYSLGKVTSMLERWSESARYFSLALELAREGGDPYSEATFLLNLVEVMLAPVEDDPRDDQVHAIIAAVRETLAAAEAADNALIAGKAHMLLGDLLDTPDAQGHTEACIEIAEAANAPEMLRACSSRLAAHLADDDPTRAEAIMTDVYARARALGVRRGVALAAAMRASVSRAAGPRSVALERSLAALDDIEHVRDTQRDDEVRARYFGGFLGEYYAFIGYLLGDRQRADQPQRDDVDRAFTVAERMRGRVLLETLDLAGATAAFSSDTPGREQRDAVLDDIARVQRELVDAADADAARRAELLDELEALERHEAELRDAMARVDARFAAVRMPRHATVADVQAALGPDQALIAYVVAPWTNLFGERRGGSWAIAVWRDGVHVTALPGRRDIEDLVEAFTAMVQRREPLDGAAADAAGAAVLGPVLDALPPRVRRLVVVPDGTLLRLPFAALRHAGHRVAERYEITTAPSSTLWLRWARNDAPPAMPRFLALADPTRGPADDTRTGADPTRGAAFDGADLSPLPGARLEVAKMAAHLGDVTVTRMGEDASERMLKAADLSAFALVHFASHAIVDDLVPRRTGVVLAPGDDVQDGLLQLHEVVGLGLDGQVIVLSACESASGAFIAGEGIAGLSRAFLQAGAGVVVANLWRVRDDESAQLFDEFYRQLSRGKSVAGALASTQRILAAAGVPPVAWAGVVVIGDGDAVLFPRGSRGSNRRFRHWYAGLIALLALGFLVCAHRAS